MHTLPCHPGGAINGIEYSPGGGGSGSFIATAGADSVIKVWDPNLFTERIRYETHLPGTMAGKGRGSKFFIYSLRAVGPWLLSGAENGTCMAFPMSLPMHWRQVSFLPSKLSYVRGRDHTPCVAYGRLAGFP